MLTRIVSTVAIAIIIVQPGFGYDDKNSAENTVQQATAIFDELHKLPNEWPQTDILRFAGCIAIFPAPKEQDNSTIYSRQGVATCAAGGWSAPIFVTLSTTLWPILQGKGALQDIILVSALNRELDLQLGQSISIQEEPIPLGRLVAFVRSYDHFVPIPFNPATLRRDEEQARIYYRSPTSSDDVPGVTPPFPMSAELFVESIVTYSNDTDAHTAFFLSGRNEIESYGLASLLTLSMTTLGDIAAELNTHRSTAEVPIFFATDRLPGNHSDNIQEFTGDRSNTDELALGTAIITIPRDHRLGTVERPELWLLEFQENPTKHVILSSVTPLDKGKFSKELSESLRADPKGEALVFIHGYNVSFEEAARRLGQMTYDLGFAGVPILYSWPSKGTLLGYASDEAAVEWSSPHFLAFLQSLQDNAGVKRIYVVGHSMGNRLIASALVNSSTNHKGVSKIAEVIMAAPDIDAGVFDHIAVSLHKSASHFTIYESSTDLALKVSHAYHQFARLGDTDPTVHVFKGYDCIEATSVDTGLIGHSYIGDNSSILADIFDVIRNSSSASERFRLSPRSLDGIPYWSFRK